MALQVASLFGVLSLKDDEFKTGMKNAKSSMSDIGGQMQSTGQNMQKIGGQIALVAAPIAAAFGVATDQSMKFDEAVTNTGAVMGWNRDQIAKMKSELLTIGAGTRAGPQAVAEAMYDIAGGVADASTHMAILNAAIHTSQAGNASLAGTTKALISTMNSYGYSADKASKVSDVLTQIVGKGVGSMDEFATALPQVTGLASSLNIPLEDVGSAMAYLTTKGNTASEASTQLGGIMSALMKPNADMSAALTELGFSSGEAAIKQLGLVGALQAVAGTTTAGEKGMAALLGSQEAVRGSVSLMSEGFKGFDETFKKSIDGVTAKAEAIQMGSPAAQFDLLKSSMNEAAIEAGDALTPALQKAWETVTPLVKGITEWIGKNPELTAQIGLLAIGGVLLGGALSIVGTVVSVGGTLLTGVGALIGFLTGPLGLVVLLGALLVAIAVGYPGGLPGALYDAADAFVKLGAIVNLELLQFVRDLGNAFKLLNGEMIDLSFMGMPGKTGSMKPFDGPLVTGPHGPGKNNSGGIPFGGGPNGSIGVRANLGARAGGGSVMGGGSYLVGEQGPELFTPNVSGNISTASQTAGMMGGVNIGTINIYANDRAGGEAAMDGALRRARAQGY